MKNVKKYKNVIRNNDVVGSTPIAGFYYFYGEDITGQPLRTFAKQAKHVFHATYQHISLHAKIIRKILPGDAFLW